MNDYTYTMDDYTFGLDGRQYITREAIEEQRLVFGAENPDKQWILSDWDTWERNPFYTGPDQGHPEDEMQVYEYAGILAKNASPKEVEALMGFYGEDWAVSAIRDVSNPHPLVEHIFHRA